MYHVPMLLHRAIPIFVAASLLAAMGQSADDPDLALRRARERLLGDLDRLPRYTCVQTITRRYYRPQSEGASCKELISAYENRKSHLTLRAWDRLRLEVAIVGKENVFSWVGAPRFESGTLEELAGGGPLSSGDFGPFLNSIFSRASITFQGEEHAGNRRLVTYSYDLPLERSGYLVRGTEGWSLTAYSGQFAIDPESADIIRLTVRTAELPASNPSCQAISEVEYGRTPIHDRMILIPRQTRLVVIGRQGSETESETSYASCREYASKTRMLFDAPSGSNAIADGAQPADSATSLFPAGLRFRVRFVSLIDSDKSAAGDPIDAVLLSPIRAKNNAVLAAAGARVHARIVGFEQRPSLPDPVYQRLRTPDLVQVSLQLESIELGGKTVPLRATADQRALLGMSVFSAPVSASSHKDTGSVAIFVFPRTRVHLDKFDWEWTTLPAADDRK